MSIENTWNKLQKSGKIHLGMCGGGEDPGPTIGEMIIPDQIETMMAWRTWNVSNATLISLNGHEWPFRQRLQAECRAGYSRSGDNHERIPDDNCSCGIYCCKDVQTLNSATSITRVIGSIHIWGKVIEGSNGWKAEFAYPNELFISAETTGYTEGLKKRLEDNYGVPVYILSSTWEIGRLGKTATRHKLVVDR